MNICEKKNQIQDLLNDIYNEYNRSNETKIQSELEKSLELRTMSSNLRSLELSNREKDDRIKSLEKANYDYEIIIRDLKSKIELVQEEESENNKFDMLRIQAKEISEKSREIDRLNGLLNHFKNEKGKEEVIQSNQKEIDKVISNVESKVVKEITLNEVVESVNKETGEINPNFIYNDDIPHGEPEPSNPPTPNSIPTPNSVSKEPEPESPESEAPEPEASTGGSINSDINLSPVKTEDISEKQKENDKGKLIIVTSKKVKYYAYENELPQIVYEFNGNKVTDKPLGKRIKNEKGKYKTVLFAS
tara:strand:- start:55 stop:966 length:912 start_codon:yes stop_codon:yes gene_type:complete